MARKSYLAVKLGKPSELYDMVHTENFVLVDKKKGVAFMTVLIKRISKLIIDINFLSNE
jgi:protein SCO1/2